MGSWGITAFESDTGLDAVGVIRSNLPEDGKLKLNELVELMKQNQWTLPDISDAESHSGAMALAEVMVKFLDGDMNGLDKRFSDVTSFTANKESVHWIKNYLSETLDYKIRESEHGNKWGGWFKEQDWIAWQDHMKKLVDRMDTLLELPEEQIELFELQEQKEEQKPTLRVNIVKNGYHLAELPISEYDVLLALYEAGCDAPDAEYNLELDHYHEHWEEYENLDLNGAKLHEVNYLAAQIADFDDFQKTCLNAYMKTQESVTVKQLINAAHNINDIVLHPVANDEELGEFALNNELIEEYNHLPDEIYEALDKAKAGVKYREKMGGQFVNGGYLEMYDIKEVYDGITLPNNKPLSQFKVQFCYDDTGDSVWLDLPASHNDFAPIAEKYRILTIEDLCMLDFNTTIPYVKAHCEVNMDCFEELDELAKAVQNMDQAEIRKYKAVLEAEQPFFIKDALDLCGKLNQYSLYSHLTNPNDYAKMMVCEKFGFDYDDPIVKFASGSGFGAELMKRNGIVPTQYGGLIIPPTVEETQSNDREFTEDDSEDQEFEGMQMT